MKIPLSGKSIMIFLILIVCISGASLSFSEPGRFTKELSGDGWRLWLDSTADWQSDDIHLPPVKISSLPVNPPTCGWDNLGSVSGKEVSVPGTVEEYFWSANGNPNGNAGDFRGVSWWSTTFRLDPSLRGKLITISFESVNLRAEVFINKSLVGYDVIGNTPFNCDISDAVSFDSENRLDVRITDPVGTFDWNDENLLHWGKNRVPSVHGFGGITGRIFVLATDSVFIDDVYVRNKPKPTNADIFVTIKNSSGKRQDGDLSLSINEWKQPDKVVWQKKVTVTVPPEGDEYTFHVKAPDARLWGIKNPHLYEAVVTFTDKGKNISDTMSKRFGFRFFTVGEKSGDKRYYLNGKRVFLFAAMTRGFWPKNGIFPTPEMARKDMRAAKDFGFNMMLYHRAIGQPRSIETADEMGILAYEEPGGYLCRPAPDENAQQWRREKLRRMVIRDRSHPSMVIFNLDDLSYAEPSGYDMENIRLVHELDPSRIVTYNCIIRPKIPNFKDDPMKLHMLPFDDTFHYHGWTSPYHLIRYGCYLDEYYRNPRYYLRYVIDPVADMGDSLHPMAEDEIIFFGEEGAIGAPVRLEKIKNELARTGADGWREGEHLDRYASYDRFLDASGLRSSFPTVDHLTMALGVNMHYFHGRILENTRISNKTDAYVLNGWASGGTHTDLVDAYRNPTADTSILRHYTQPLYVAVKLRDKVLPVNASTVADIFIVNEVNLRGNLKLTLELHDPGGHSIFSKTTGVNISGGEEFGQLVAEYIHLPTVEKPGYYTLSAVLCDTKGTVKATGRDKIFAVDYLSGILPKSTVSVIDTSGTVANFLNKAGKRTSGFDPNGPPVDFLVIGEHDFNKVRNLGREKNTRTMDLILERVANGTTLIVLDQADRWAQRLGTSVVYSGSVHRGNGGRLFVGTDNVLRGLPQSQGMNWEYQVFYRGDVWGLRLAQQGIETIAALASEHSGEILDAVCRIRFGTGQIILSTLRILPELGSEKPQSAVAKKLFINMLEK